jgi:hypothetical protein
MQMAVFRIRIHMFFDLPDPDPLVRGMDPERIRILPSLSKNSKKNLDFYSFVTSFDFLSLKNDVKVPSKSTMKKTCYEKIRFLLAS